MPEDEFVSDFKNMTRIEENGEIHKQDSIICIKTSNTHKQVTIYKTEIYNIIRSRATKTRPDGGSTQ